MRGLCSACQQSRYLEKGHKKCKSCRSSVAPCSDCGKTRRIYADQLCGICYEDHRVRTSLLEVTSQFKACSDYNADLFELYLIYIRRYRLKYFHLKQIKKIIKTLEENPIPTLSSWMDIYQLAERYPLFHHSSSKKGCAVTKIGVMLQELGVLPPRADELGRQLKTIQCGFSSASLPLIQKFEQTLLRANRSASTVHSSLSFLRLFEQWLKTHVSESSSLLDAGATAVEGFLFAIMHPSDVEKDTQEPEVYRHPKYRYNAYHSLHRFYRFCLSEKKILSNPCDSITISPVPFQIQVCPPDQIQKLQAYVKNPHSNPEYALLICLVLFFGLTTEDLAFAQIQELKLEKPMTLVLRRKPRTRGRRYYHRTQTLSIPCEPFWLARLQKNFLTQWQAQYSQVKSTYPRLSLLLPRSQNFNRPLSSDTIRERLSHATQEAVGVNIPIRVLRQTCGHLHTHGQDASSLTRLGWSPQFAFHYSWRPKTFFTPKPPKSSPT